MKRILQTLVTALTVLHFPFSSVFAQGSLTPPGAPVPTMKTLDQLSLQITNLSQQVTNLSQAFSNQFKLVEPRFPISVIPTNLTVSGSYYLTTNLFQTLALAAITIGNNDITIDLNGFALIGNNSTGEGITYGGINRNNICIKNGTIRNWQNGLQLTGGGNGLIDHVRIYANTENGIIASAACTVMDCYVADNGQNGILLSGAVPSLVRDCVVRGNALDGIRVVGNAVIMGNQCIGLSSLASTNAGIRATSSGNRIDGNHVTFYGNGILVSGTGNLVIRNTTSLTAADFVVNAGNITGPTNNLTSPHANFAY